MRRQSAVRDVSWRTYAHSGRAFGRGIVSIEMLLVIVPVLLAFLGVMQLALIGLSFVVVHHSATRAARAAVVVLDDAPEHYGGAERGSLTQGEPAQGPDFGLEASVPVGVNDEKPRAQGARLAAIRQAAYAALAVLSPPPERLGILPSRTDLRSAFANSHAARIATGLFVTSPALAEIRLTAPAPGDDAASAERASLTEIAPTAEFSVVVDYLFPCLVPWVRSLVCRSGRTLLLEERERAPEVEHPRLRQLLLASGHYFPVHAEVTALNQGARYHPEAQ